MIQSILMAILFFFMFSVLSKLVTMINVPQQQLLSPIFQHTCFHLRKTKCLPHETLTKISTFQYRKFNSNCDTIENEMQQIKRYSTLITNSYWLITVWKDWDLIPEFSSVKETNLLHWIQNQNWQYLEKIISRNSIEQVMEKT